VKLWGVPAEEIEVVNGVVSHAGSGRGRGFGELAGFAAELMMPENATLKEPADFTLIGRYATRRDVVPKVNGTAEYAMDVRLPGMLTAVVARPPRFGGTARSFDATKAKAVAGVTDVVAIPQGVAVVAETTWAAIRGRAALTIDWDESAAETRGSERSCSPHTARFWTRPAGPFRVEGDVSAALAGAATVVEAVYEFPFLAHAPLEPLNCVARLGADDCEIWAGSQIQTWDQANAAAAAGLDVRSVRINTLFAGGSFGRRANPPSDYISEAVHVAKASGGRAPVHLVWTREDDIRGGRYRPLYHHGLRGGLDAMGNPVAGRQRSVGQALQANTPFEGALVVDGIDLTSVEGVRDMSYGVPNLACDLHTTTVGVPVLWWRSVGHTHTAFAVESFVDELAAAAGRDPLELRRSLLANDPRKLAVLNLAADKAAGAAPCPRAMAVAWPCTSPSTRTWPRWPRWPWRRRDHQRRARGLRRGLRCRGQP
jgi:isoquinoline 1-oxidoreductase beta subunit